MTKTLISHVGIAVRDLEKAKKIYSLLTGEKSPVVEEIQSEKVRVAIFASGRTGEGKIELVAATADDSPIAKFISKRGEGLHHICLYVDDIKAKLAELKKAGVKMLDETHRTGAEGKKIAFVHPANFNGVLIELEERKSD